MKNIITFIQTITHSCLMIYSWRDVLEISIITISLYSFMKWLCHDSSKAPFKSFLAYTTLSAVSYYAQFMVLSNLLLFCSPLALVILLLVHQQTLQKNFVTSKIIKPANSTVSLWIDDLIQASLTALNKQKEIIWVIERQDSMRDFLASTATVNATLSKEVLELFMDYIPPHTKTMVWLNDAGKVVALNVSAKLTPDPIWLSPDLSHHPAWKQTALFIASKTDAIILAVLPETRTLSCIMEGTCIEEMSAFHLRDYLKRICLKSFMQSKEKQYHGINNTKPKHEQLAS